MSDVHSIDPTLIEGPINQICCGRRERTAAEANDISAIARTAGAPFLIAPQTFHRSGGACLGSQYRRQDTATVESGPD